MLGVFLALDFFLFYVFWEVMLLPMYFLIGVWGGPRKEYAAIKFFLYTLVGSVLMLIAILMLYFTSDLADPAAAAAPGQVPISILRCRSRRRSGHEPSDRRRSSANVAADPHVQHPGPAADRPAHHAARWLRNRSGDRQPILFLGHGLQWWAFLLLFIGFAIKVPAVPRAHLVARCPRRSTDADLDDPGRRAAEDGRLRHHPHLLSRSARTAATTWRGSSAASAWSAWSTAPSPPWPRRTSSGWWPTARSATWVTWCSASASGRPRAGNGYNAGLLEHGRQRGDVPDDRPRHQLGRHVLYGRRHLRPRASPQPERVRRPVRQDAATTRRWPSASSSPASACRACAASSAKCSSCSPSGSSATCWPCSRPPS